MPRSLQGSKINSKKNFVIIFSWSLRALAADNMKEKRWKIIIENEL